MSQGAGKQAAGKQGAAPAKQGQAGATEKQAATPSSAQSQAPTQANPAASSKAKPAKQASKVQQQQKGGADGQAMTLPSDVFAHLPQYHVSWTDTCLTCIQNIPLCHQAERQERKTSLASDLKTLRACCGCLLELIAGRILQIQ